MKSIFGYFFIMLGILSILVMINNIVIGKSFGESIAFALICSVFGALGGIISSCRK